MIGYSNCGLAYDDNGRPMPGCVVPYNQEPAMLSYVMIDPGTPLPHVTASPQARPQQAAATGFGYFGLGQDEETEPTPAPAPAATQMSSKELFNQLYAQNKIAFWVGGGIFGLLALSGLYNLIGGRG